MEPSSKIVGSPPPAANRKGMAMSASMVLRLQQVVGNREVQRLLVPKPAVEVPPPPPAPPPPAPRRLGQGIRYCLGGATGALVGGGGGVAMHLPLDYVAAMVVTGLGAGAFAAWFLGRRKSGRGVSPWTKTP